MSKITTFEKSNVKEDINFSLIDVDEVWNNLGRWGKYQVVQLILIMFANVSLSFAVLSGIFVGSSVDFICDLNNSLDFSTRNNTVKNQCHFEIWNNLSKTYHIKSCQHFSYAKLGKFTSYISEFNLICEREAMGQLPQMLTMIGMMVGASTLPILGDKYGRKKLYTLCCVLCTAVSIGIAFAPSFEVLLLLKFLDGTLNQGLMISLYILTLELFPTELRVILAFLATTAWVMSVSCIVLVAYVFQDYDWRQIQMTYGIITGITMLTIVPFIDESFRWMIANRNIPGATEILKKACIKNKKNYNVLFLNIFHKQPIDMKKEIQEAEELTSPDVKIKQGVTDIFKNKPLRIITLINCYFWMTNSLTYYGITLLSTSLAGDQYLNFFLSTIVEFPSAMIMVPFLNRFGRRFTNIVNVFMAGLCLLATVILATLAENSAESAKAQTALTLLGKFFISVTFNAVWLYTPELYPTNLRNAGLGIASMSARITAATSPFFKILADKVIWAPGVLFSTCCLLAAFGLTFLPETGWRELPETVEEVESWYHEDKPKGKLQVIKYVLKRPTRAKKAKNIII